MVLIRLLACLLLSLSGPVFGFWTVGIGYKNPPNADVGVNLFYYSMDYGIEIGIGHSKVYSIDTNADVAEEDDTGVAVALGAANFKYFLLGSFTKIYIQGGFGTSAYLEAGKSTSGNFNLGNPYGGLGLMIGGPALYVYGGAITLGENYPLQAGFGMTL